MSIYGFSVKDLIAQERFTEDELNVVKEWAKRQSELPKFTDETLALFYMACQNNLEATKKCARSYYHAKKEAPELFNDRDLTRNDIQHQLKILNFAIMPQRTDEGYVICLHRLVDPDYTQYHMEVAMKVLFMTMDCSVYDDPPTGIITLFDMQGVGLRHLTRVKLGAVRKFFFFVQEALPLQLRAIHVLNVVWFFDKIFKLIKPFAKPEVLEHLHLHTTDADMDTFYATCIPKKCLPSDYGGDLDSVREIQKTTEKKMQDLKDFYEQDEWICTSST